MDLDAFRVHFHSLSKGLELTNGHKSKVNQHKIVLQIFHSLKGSIVGLVSGWCLVS